MRCSIGPILDRYTPILNTKYLEVRGAFASVDINSPGYRSWDRSFGCGCNMRGQPNDQPPASSSMNQ